MFSLIGIDLFGCEELDSVPFLVPVENGKVALPKHRRREGKEMRQ